MKFNSTATTVFLLSVLFLTPLYSVYAVDNSSTKSGALRPTLNQQKIDTAKLRFEDRIVGMKDKIASKEAEFKLRMDKFKDQVKAQIALRVNKNLNMINQNQTAMMSKNLDTFGSILDRVVTKAGGTATSSAQVAAARSALDSAKTTVTNQALKDYTVNISTESAIHKDTQAMREKLHADLKTTRDSVIAAKQAVITAIRSILNPVASSSASPSATLKTKESTATGLPVSQ